MVLFTDLTSQLSQFPCFLQLITLEVLQKMEGKKSAHGGHNPFRAESFNLITTSSQ